MYRFYFNIIILTFLVVFFNHCKKEVPEIAPYICANNIEDLLLERDCVRKVEVNLQDSIEREFSHVHNHIRLNGYLEIDIDNESGSDILVYYNKTSWSSLGGFSDTRNFNIRLLNEDWSISSNIDSAKICFEFYTAEECENDTIHPSKYISGEIITIVENIDYCNQEFSFKNDTSLHYYFYKFVNGGGHGWPELGVIGEENSTVYYATIQNVTKQKIYILDFRLFDDCIVHKSTYIYNE